MSGLGVGMMLWIISIMFFIVLVLFGGINYIVIILNMCIKGMSFWCMLLIIWFFFVIVIIGLFFFLVFLVVLVLFIFDWGMGISFFLSEIFIGG